MARAIRLWVATAVQLRGYLSHGTQFGLCNIFLATNLSEQKLYVSYSVILQELLVHLRAQLNCHKTKKKT